MTDPTELDCATTLGLEVVAKTDGLFVDGADVSGLAYNAAGLIRLYRAMLIAAQYKTKAAFDFQELQRITAENLGMEFDDSPTFLS